MKYETLDEFGKNIITEVRDNTLDTYERIKVGSLKSKNKVEIFNRIESLDENAKNVLDDVVYNIVDLMLFNMLNNLEQSYEVKFENEIINDLSDGLSAELYSENGWIKRYSLFASSEKD